MKQKIALLLAAAMILSLTACAGSGTVTPGETPGAAASAAVPEPGASEAGSDSGAAPAEAPAASPAQSAGPSARPSASPAARPSADPDEPGTLVELTGDQQYAANLSLSNFSEQYFCERGFGLFDSDKANIGRLFRFAVYWAKINRPSVLESDGNYLTMSREDFFDIVTPRLGYPKGLEPEEGDDYSSDFSMLRDRCWYENGCFHFPAAAEESSSRFTVVDEAYLRSDGTYRFLFTVYEMDRQRFQEEGIPSAYYHLTPEEAAYTAAGGDFRADRYGEAICSPEYWESSRMEMYRLEKYEIDYYKRPVSSWEGFTVDPGELGTSFTLTEERQYAANLCMSNFAEQYFGFYDSEDTTVPQLFRFAHMWARINSPSLLGLGRSCETLRREDFFAIITQRLEYPEWLGPREGDDYSDAFDLAWGECWYEDGLFYNVAAYGDSYNDFAVVDEAYELDDGTCGFRFSIYALDLEIYRSLGMASEYYHLTPAEAAEREAAGEIALQYRGIAICTPEYWENAGMEMYRLRHYEHGPWLGQN